MSFLDKAGEFLAENVGGILDTAGRVAQWAGAPGAADMLPPPTGGPRGGGGPGGPSSINNRSINVGGPDPIQGYDVGVWMEDKGRGHAHVLVGQFTSIVLTVKNATEAYIPVGFRQPIYFDGEIQISFSLEKGLLDTAVFKETFGVKTFNWNNRYLRSPRFKLTFAIDPVDWMSLDEPSNQFGEVQRRHAAGRFVLEMCKIDTWTMGAQAGKQVVATQWTGVAQQIWHEPLTLDNMQDEAKRSQYDPRTGEPLSNDKVPTFYFSGYADRASTKVRPVNQSRSKYPPWLTPRMLLEAEKKILTDLMNNLPFGAANLPGVKQVFDELLAAIDRIQAKMGIPGTAAGRSSVAVSTSPNMPVLDQKSSGPVASFGNLIEVVMTHRNQVLAQLQQAVTQVERDRLQREFDDLSAQLDALRNTQRSSGPSNPNQMTPAPLVARFRRSTDQGVGSKLSQRFGNILWVQQQLAEARANLRLARANPARVREAADLERHIEKLERAAFGLYDKGGDRSRAIKPSQLTRKLDTHSRGPKGSDPEMMAPAPLTNQFQRSTSPELVVALAGVRAKVELAIQAATAAGDTDTAAALSARLDEFDSIGRNFLPPTSPGVSAPAKQASSHSGRGRVLSIDHDLDPKTPAVPRSPLADLNPFDDEKRSSST